MKYILCLPLIIFFVFFSTYDAFAAEKGILGKWRGRDDIVENKNVKYHVDRNTYSYIEIEFLADQSVTYKKVPKIHSRARTIVGKGVWKADTNSQRYSVNMNIQMDNGRTLQLTHNVNINSENSITFFIEGSSFGKVFNRYVYENKYPTNKEEINSNTYEDSVLYEEEPAKIDN